MANSDRILNDISMYFLRFHVYPYCLVPRSRNTFHGVKSASGIGRGEVRLRNKVDLIFSVRNTISFPSLALAFAPSPSLSFFWLRLRLVFLSPSYGTRTITPDHGIVLKLAEPSSLLIHCVICGSWNFSYVESIFPNKKTEKKGAYENDS